MRAYSYDRKTGLFCNVIQLREDVLETRRRQAEALTDAIMDAIAKGERFVPMDVRVEPSWLVPADATLTEPPICGPNEIVFFRNGVWTKRTSPRRVMRRALAAVIAFGALLLTAAAADAQSTPGFYTGQVPSAAQWNSYFAAKQDVLGFVPLNRAGDTMTGELVLKASSSVISGLNLPQGTAPASPVNGDVWTTAAGMFARINGSTITLSGSVSNVLASGNIYVGNVSNVATSVTPSGDVGLTNAGVFTVTGVHGTSALNTNLNASSLIAAQTGALFQGQQVDSVVARSELDAFGAITAFTGVIAGGTKASPTAVTSGTQLTGINAYAYNGASYVGPIVSFRTYAGENIASGHQGSKACIATTPTASTSLADGLCQFPSTGIVLGSPTGGDKGAGTLNAAGTIYVNGTAVLTALPGDVAYLDVVQSFTKSQRGTPQSLSAASSTITPNFDNGNNFTVTLVHANSPFTFANPSTTPVAGQSGVIEVIQSSSSPDLISTWGSDYTAAGGTSTLALTSGANARDYISYYVADATHIVLSVGVSNATH
jgi:hypothetical protein